MGITVIPHCLLEKKPSTAVDELKKLSEIALTGKYYRHPDSAMISYPLAVQEPLGSITKPVNIAIVGGGAAGIASLYELCSLKNSSNNIRITLYESDREHFVYEPEIQARPMTTGLRAGRICAAVSSDKPGGLDHAAYEVGAMRFPEIAGLTWHYASLLYGADVEVGVFPNPGTVPTEVVHGDRVDRFGSGVWLDSNSPTKKVVEIIRAGLFGESQANKPNTSIFLIGGEDPAKISAKLTSERTTEKQLAQIYKAWKEFTIEYDNRTLESAVREIVENQVDQLPNVSGLMNKTDKINYYVELFGTVGFGTGGFKPLYKMSFLEMMRLLLWNYSEEHVLPVKGNVHFIKDLFVNACQKNPNVVVKKARVNDVCHLDQNPNGSALLVYYDVTDDGSESSVPQIAEHDFVILATTPKQTSYMISRIGFNNVPRRIILGDYERPLLPENYVGYVRPALVLSNESEAGNSKLFTAINHIHMASSSKVFASIKRCEYDQRAPQFLTQGKIKAVLSDCGLGSSYVIPSTVLNEANEEKYKDYYSILVSYSWEDDAKRLQHHFRQYPINKTDTKLMMNALINRTVRYVTDPVDHSVKPWWFGDVLSTGSLEDALSYDWTTFNSSGAFKLDKTGDHYNTHLLFRYHTHATKPELKNKFFIANCSYSHLGGWVEGAFMSAINAVCGLIVAANDGNVNALSSEARKVVESLVSVVEK